MRYRLAYVQMAFMILVLGYLVLSAPAISEGDEIVLSSVEETSDVLFSKLSPTSQNQPLSASEKTPSQWYHFTQAQVTEGGTGPHSPLIVETRDSATGFLRMSLEGLNDPSSGWEITPLDVPPPPKLLSPANGSVLNTLIPVLEIDTGIPETPNSPKIELSLDAQFTTSRLVGFGCGQRWGHFDWFDVPGTRSGSGNLLPSTRYYWRARTAYGNACEVASPEWGSWSEASFVTGSGGVLLPGPQLLSPPDGATVFDLRPTLSWQPVSGAQGMMIWVLGTTPGTRGGGTSRNRPSTDYQPYWDLTPGGIYEWRVYYRNEYAWGEPSSYWKFSVSLASLAVSGRVLDSSGNGMPRVIISDTAGHSVTTSDSGQYRLDHLVAGTYTIAPTRSGYVFCPAARTVTIPPNATEQNFRGVAGGTADPCPGRAVLPLVLQ